MAPAASGRPTDAGWEGRLLALQRAPEARHTHIELTAREDGSASAATALAGSRRDGGSAVHVAVEPGVECLTVSLFDVGGGAVAIEASADCAPAAADAVRAAMMPDLESAPFVMFAATPARLRWLAVEAVGQAATGGDGPFRCWVRQEVLLSGGAVATTAKAAAPPGPGLRQVPAGYELGQLRPGDAELVNARWPYNAGVRTVEMIRDCIKERPSGAVRETATGKPVAWAVTRNDGSVGMLHVEDAHRLKGLATAVMASVDEQLRSRGQSPFFYISEENKASETVATKLGYVPVFDGGYFWQGFCRNGKGDGDSGQ